MKFRFIFIIILLIVLSYNKTYSEILPPTNLTIVFGIPKPPKIFTVGDSIVSTYSEDSDKQGWGYTINDFFVNSVQVINKAIGGRSTKTFIEEGRWDITISEFEKGDYVLIQFGHNDSHNSSYPESTDANTDYKMYLRQYINDSRNNGVTPILVTPTHRRIFHDGILSKELEPYANAMKEVANEMEANCVDLYTLSGEVMQTLGEEESLYLFCSEIDHSHFSLEGAIILAELIIEDILTNNIIPSKYIKND